MGNMQSFDRSAGILMAVSSLPSPYGIGTFGKEAYKFVDFVHASRHRYWQVLPLGPTTYGDSPYQSFSAFAGNPYLIDLDMLVEEGLLTKSYLLSKDWGDGFVPVQVSEEDAEKANYTCEYDINLGNECYVSYEKMFLTRFEVLHTAYNNFIAKQKGQEAYHRFEEENRFWLDDYAMFMAVKEHFNQVAWSQWEDSIRFRTPEGMDKFRNLLCNQINFWKFVQYEFDKQWSRLKAYANEHQVSIIGDIPIYMGYDSADVWANAKDFQLDENLTPTKVAGVPPDAFSELGQKWGNPLYEWDQLEKEEYKWWYLRMKKSAELYDVIRIDHFIGIVKYYSMDADIPDARQGEYRDGPGEKLTEVINKAIGDKKIIAEDLGIPVPEVDALLAKNHYPGMKVLEFAFGGDRTNPHLPFNYERNSVVYGGTHDNETLLGYFEEREDNELAYAIDYLDTNDRKSMVDQVFRIAYASVAELVVFAVQDILKLGNWSRMNEPSTLGKNWKWRMKKDELTSLEEEQLRHLANIYGREL